MTFLQFLATYGLTILSVIATIISLIIVLIKAKKSGNSKGMIAILEMIPNLVNTAESLFGKGHGQAKQCKVDINALTDQVNSVVTTTNSVNIDKTQKVEKPTENIHCGAINENHTSDFEDTINI